MSPVEAVTLPIPLPDMEPERSGLGAWFWASLVAGAVAVGTFVVAVVVL